MFWTASSVGTFDTFIACSASLLKSEDKAAAIEAKTKAFALKNTFKILEFFEQKYACSGICNPALFYYSIPIS